MGVVYLPSMSFETRHITNFVLEVTRQCNLRCTYCCYSGSYEGFWAHSAACMTDETLDLVIGFICRHAHPSDNLSVSFYGGEALLCLPAIVRTVGRLHQLFGSRISFDISTNGYALDSRAVTTIVNLPQTGVSVSLDGCRETHDANRRGLHGEPTYDVITANLLRFKALYPDEYHKRIRILITAKHLSDIRIMQQNFGFLSSLLGEKPLLVSKVSPNFSTGHYYWDSLEEKQRFMRKALAYKDRGEHNLYTILLDELLKKAVRKSVCPPGCRTIRHYTCMNNLYSCFINCLGELYPCEKVAEGLCIGSVGKGFELKKMRSIAVAYSLRRSLLCNGCKAVEYCRRCPKDLSMSYLDNKMMCREYQENIELALELAADLNSHS